MSENVPNHESYRDKISTVDEAGKRIWVFPKKPNGPYTRAREIVALFLLLILFGTPFIRINGNPFLLFDIIHRNLLPVAL